MTNPLSHTDTVPLQPIAWRLAEHLSFAAQLPDGSREHWHPSPAENDWDIQCRIGRRYGEEAVDYIRRSGDAALLPAIIRSIMKRGAFGGAETGFFTAIALAIELEGPT